MMIINYWQKISKRYFLSHLFLGVIAAGFGLTSSALALPNQMTGQPVTILNIVSIAKAQAQEQLSVPSLQQIRHDHFIKQSSFAVFISASYLNYSLFPQHTSRFGFSLANAIRAGPTINTAI